MKQERVQKQTGTTKRTEPQVENVQSTASSTAALKEEMDAVLADIDAVLEENAQEFVESYIQKGGE